MAIQADRNALFEIDRDFAVAVRAGARIQRQLKKILRWRFGRIFENSAFVAHVPEVGIVAVDLLGVAVMGMLRAFAYAIASGRE